MKSELLYLEDARFQLEVAALPTRRRIEVELARVPVKLHPLLAHISRHLFEPSLTVESLKEACGIHDNSISILFHSWLGLSPYRFICECRFETAARLLRETNIQVWQVSELIGYAALPSFSRAFRRWFGVSPQDFRQRSRQVQQVAPALATDPHLGRYETIRRIFRGALEPELAALLIRDLRRVYAEP